MTEGNGEKVQGYYAQHLTKVIGEGAYDNEGHRNAQFMSATNVGPYPAECTRAWKASRDAALHNLGVEGRSGSGRLGEDGTTGGPHTSKRE